MTHNPQQPPEVVELLQGKQRHLLVKHNPLHMPNDTLVISQVDSREQLSFTIVSITKLHSRTDLLGLYAPYNAEDDVIELEIGGSGSNSNPQ